MPASERGPDSASALPPAHVLSGLRIEFGKECDSIHTTRETGTNPSN
jgi:hypothetical protein